MKQALGRWTMFFVLLIPFLILMFIPRLKVLPIIAYMLLLGVWVIFFMQAWNGRYTSFSQDKAFMPVFA
ncbi:MAG: hypothetical protein WCJ81_04105 [bacterium]